jgi:hypothetical protein
MKPNNKKHSDLAISGTIPYRKNALSKRFQTGTHNTPVEDAQELARLNQLAGKPPFCAWQRQKNNDPL